MALTNLNKLFVRVTEAGLRDAVIAKSKEANNNKIYFLTKTQEIVTQGVAYGLSTDVQAQIANIKSILKTFDNNGNGTEDSVKAAIDTVQAVLDAYKKDNDAKRALLVKTVAYNADTKAIDFTAEGGTVQSIPVSKIIGNHLVESSSYNADTNHLTLTFKGAENPVNVDIDLGQMLDMNDVVSGDKTRFEAKYADGKLTITPVIKKVASDTVGLADAKDVKSYVDDAVNGATTDLQGKIDTINGKLDVIQGEDTVDGSIKKALKDAKEYADDLNTTATAAITKETEDRKAADKALYGAEIPADGASTISGNAANIAALTSALEAEKINREAADTTEKTTREKAIKEITDALADPATFWEDYTA
nr:MAG TPA: hypothetical protein [Ackermannviridae sp.]